MAKQALQGSERNLFELSLAIQNAKTSLQIGQASSQIGRGIAIQLDHLPGFDDELRLLTASEKQELQKNAPEIG